MKYEITKEQIEELWLPVHNYYGFYEVSNMGNVRSLSREVKHSRNPEFTKKVFGKILSKTLNVEGYNKVRLSMFGLKRTHLVYHLVSEVFLGHTDRSEFVCVDHIDEDKTNDKVSNLQIISKQQNTKKSFDYKLEAFNAGDYWFHSTGKLVLIFEVTKKNGGTIKCKHIDNTDNFAFHGIACMDRKASESEVFEALKNEAINKGYKNGNHYCLNSCITEKNVEDKYLFDNGNLWYGTNASANCVFQKGIWAPIIPVKQMTQSDIEKELGYKIEILK